MTQPPDLIVLNDFAEWNAYEDAIYAIYLETVAHAGLTFCGSPLKVRFKPKTKHKGYGFWHLISEAPDQRNRNEEDRIPICGAVSVCTGWHGAYKTPMQVHRGFRGGKTSVGERRMLCSGQKSTILP